MSDGLRQRLAEAAQRLRAGDKDAQTFYDGVARELRAAIVQWWRRDETPSQRADALDRAAHALALGAPVNQSDRDAVEVAQGILWRAAEWVKAEPDGDEVLAELPVVESPVADGDSAE